MLNTDTHTCHVPIGLLSLAVRIALQGGPVLLHQPAGVVDHVLHSLPEGHHGPVWELAGQPADCWSCTP